MRLSTSPRWEGVCAGALVVLAAWLRLRHLGEAVALRIGRDILHGDFRTVGLTSSSLAANPPLYVYVVAGPLAFSNNPLFATGAVAVLAVLAVALTYPLLRGRFGGGVTLPGVGLFATAPWAVLYQDFVLREGGTAGDYGVVYDDTAALAAAARERGLNADDPATEYLVWGKLGPPEGVTPQVRMRNRLRDASPLPCAGVLRAFGPLDACFPR